MPSGRMDTTIFVCQQGQGLQAYAAQTLPLNDTSSLDLQSVPQ